MCYTCVHLKYMNDIPLIKESAAMNACISMAADATKNAANDAQGHCPALKFLS